MANYIGNEPQFQNSPRDYFVGDGVQTTFTLTYTPGGANGIIVVISGLIQKPSIAYYVSGKTLVFTEAPPIPLSGEANNIEVIYLQKLGVSPSVRWTGAPIATNIGTNNDLIASYSPINPTLVNNLLLYVVLSSPNSSSTPTFSPDGLLAKVIVSSDGTPIPISRLKDTVLLRYNSGLDKWVLVNSLGIGATGGGGDDVFYENSKTVTANYTISTNKNAFSSGPITINNGVTVTIPDGSSWTIL